MGFEASNSDPVHVVLIRCDGYVKFQASTSYSGSEPTLGRSSAELIEEIKERFSRAFPLVTFEILEQD